MKLTNTVISIELTDEEIKALEVLDKANKQCDVFQVPHCNICPFGPHSPRCLCYDASKILKHLRKEK